MAELPDPLPNPYSWVSGGQTITMETPALEGETEEETAARHRTHVIWAQKPRSEGGGGFPPDED